MTTATSTTTNLVVRLHPWLVPVKVGAAGAIAAWAAGLWVREDVISAAFVALICCRPAVFSALREARDQVLASVLGLGVTAAVLLAVGPHPAVAIGLGAALCWRVADWMRWTYPTVVVALFTVVYMGVLSPHGGILDTALIRSAAVAVGIGAALLVNVAWAPLLSRAKHAVRLGELRAAVAAQLGRLDVAVGTRDPQAFAAARGVADGLYRQLGDTRAELVDLRRDAQALRGLLQRPGGEARDRAPAAALALEQVIHHAQDAAEAARAMIADAPAAGPAAADDALLLAGAREAFAAAATAVTGGRPRPAREAGLMVRALDAGLAAPEAVERRLGPRLLLLVALAAMLEHAALAADAMAALDALDRETT